jgi:hypothetical protein
MAVFRDKNYNKFLKVALFYLTYNCSFFQHIYFIIISEIVN